MTLNEYFARDGALTVAQLRAAIGAKSDAQVRQWQHGYGGRRPGLAYCVAIERTTQGAVTRRDLRPDDWHLIWPELAADSEQNQAPAGTTPAQAAINEVASGEGVNACAD